MQHTRDARGNVTIKYKEPERKGGFKVVSVTFLTFLLTLAATGVLLHFSMKNNEANVNKINRLEQEIARTAAPTNITAQIQDPAPAAITVNPTPAPVEVQGETTVE